MTAPLGKDSLPALTALCARSLTDPPSGDELARTLFAADQPATIRGDPERGVIATVESVGNGHVRLLVVDPAQRGRGLGRELLELGEQDLRERGFSSVTDRAAANGVPLSVSLTLPMPRAVPGADPQSRSRKNPCVAT